MEEEKAKEKEKTPETAEEATTVGMFLKYTRMKQKKSIEAVSDALCIRKIYIKALEEDDYETLAPIPYGIGFVRSYAKYLGLNVDRVAQFYKQQAMPKKEKVVSTVVTNHAEKTMPSKHQMYIALLAIVLLYALWLAFRFIPGFIKEQEPQAESLPVIEVMPFSEEPEEIFQPENIEPAENEGAAEGEVAAENQITVVEENYVEPTEETEPKSRVVLKFKGDSWVELKDAEKVYLSGVHGKGFEYEAPDVEGLVLSIGRYYNVEVYIDGKLTTVATPKKQTKIKLDNYLKH